MMKAIWNVKTHYAEDYRPNKRRKTAPCAGNSGAGAPSSDFSTFVGSNTLTSGTRDRT